MPSTATLFVLCTLLLELVRQVEARLPDNSTWGVGQGHGPPSVWGVQLDDVGPTVYLHLLLPPLLALPAVAFQPYTLHSRVLAADHGPLPVRLPPQDSALTPGEGLASRPVCGHVAQSL